MVPFEIFLLGDAALLVRTTAEVDHAWLLRARERIAAAWITGATEVVIGYASIAVYFDHAMMVKGASLDSGADEGRIGLLTEALHAGDASMAKAFPARVEIPVCYDAEFAFDLADIARRARLSDDEVIAQHAEATYCVRCVGFTPGFPYLSGLPAHLATPRRATPRTKVPAGSVAIGGVQTGIYPAVSPGGWNVIGRTPLRLFDPEREPPALLRAGDEVRFRPITREEFSAVAQARE